MQQQAPGARPDPQPAPAPDTGLHGAEWQSAPLAPACTALAVSACCASTIQRTTPIQTIVHHRLCGAGAVGRGGRRAAGAAGGSAGCAAARHGWRWGHRRAAAPAAHAQCPPRHFARAAGWHAAPGGTWGRGLLCGTTGGPAAAALLHARATADGGGGSGGSRGCGCTAAGQPAKQPLFLWSSWSQEVLQLQEQPLPQAVSML